MRKIIFVLILVVLFVSIADAKGKKKKAKSKEVEDIRPSHIQKELYCNSCQAIIRELLKKLRDKTSEQDVVDAMEDICNPKYYSIYDFPPPDMRKGCEAYINGHEEIIEKALIERKGNRDVEQYVCYTKTKACVDVDMNSEKNRRNTHVTIDGKQVPVGDDGAIDIGAPKVETEEL
eukprot:CAMPEP_0176446550 /NCGR_PEP_ID=MMETSP0127-20121128/24397_1 /TAXON_ID=938130 /ORGANISM="Platyophrya macrostoma, Strain WH" /LENGTH=175 /DNA_ID=CAMNT_0017832615 /DNA_START=45 /DNA_END=572 /DNA_ORIENTATION=+